MSTQYDQCTEGMARTRNMSLVEGAEVGFSLKKKA